MNADNPVTLDTQLIAREIRKPLIVDNNNTWYLLDTEEPDVQDGLWLIDIEGMHSIKKITKIPVSKIRVCDNDVIFDCAINEINFIGRVYLVISRY
nr:hypothetical protein [Photorhabdus hindustanensis]